MCHILWIPAKYSSFGDGSSLQGGASSLPSLQEKEAREPRWPALSDNTFGAARVAARAVRVLRDHRALAGIFLFALTLRVAYNLTVARRYVPLHDAAQYVQLARNLLQFGCYCFNGPGYPTTVRPPVYPLFLAGIFAPFGIHPLLGRLALSIVGAGTCVLVSVLAHDLFGRAAGITAGLIAATYPQLFIWDAWLYSESLAIFLYAASCLAVMRVLRRPTAMRWVLVGALIGVTALTRPNGIYALLAVVAAVALAVLTRKMRLRYAVASVGLLLVGTAAAMAPWTVRNYVVTGGAFVPISTGGGIVVAGSYNDDVYYGPRFLGEWVNPLDLQHVDAADRELLQSFPRGFACAGACEVARDQVDTRVAVKWATSHLDLMPQLLLMRTRQFWPPGSGPVEGGMPVARWYADTYPTIIIALALLGLFGLLCRHRDVRVFVFCFFGVAVIAGGLIFYGSPRMRAPLEPFMVVLASGIVTELGIRLAAYVHRRRLGA
ncbi:MAG TPA: glycosyltransferase family 39 protein [Ktedonobacterales bacterium]|nr:glycosyltransferase family 39 protein [Ktedonobacterales bacterium]